MKVLYDYQAFAMQKYGGISRCFYELYNHLPDGVKGTISLLESDNAYTSQLEGVHPNGYLQEHFICKRHFFGKGHLFLWTDKFRKHKFFPNYNKNYSIEQLRAGEYDVFHPTFFDDYFLPYLNGKPFVLTIHDMIPEQYPQYYSENEYQIAMKRRLAPLASAIVAVSETTKKDVIRILGVPEKKVHVVYHGCSLPEVEESSSPFSFPYIFYVGSRWGYKNFTRFVELVAPLLKRYENLYIVCSGGEFVETELTLFESLGLSGRFIQRWVKDDTELYSLYHHAVCFVYPSEYEGFGIPILEAYKANCPVVLNYESCFPEIAGDAALYFHMNSNHSNLEEQIEKVLNMNDAERKLLLGRQLKRLSFFSWESSAKNLADIYKSVVRTVRYGTAE